MSKFTISNNPANKKLAVLWIVLGIFSRLIPHPANFTPLTNLCFFAGTKFNRFFSLILVAISLIASDLVLSAMRGSIAFGWITLFTYSGWFGMLLVANKICKKTSLQSSFFYVLGFETVFWLWTNFGFWLTQGLYPRSAAGLITCYIAGLPFLRTALIGDIIWFAVIFGIFETVYKLITKNMQQKISV